MITLIVMFCLSLNQYMCYELRMVPDDYRAIASPMECLRGGAVSGMQFVMQHQEYTVKGWRCNAGPPSLTAVSEWVAEEKARLRRTSPQIK